jgi:hypothetical protein
MAHRPALRNIAMLYQKETVLGVSGKDLEIQVRACARPMMLCPSRVRVRSDNTGFPNGLATSANDLKGGAKGSATATFKKLRRSTLFMAEMLLLARETCTRTAHDSTDWWPAQSLAPIVLKLQTARHRHSSNFLNFPDHGQPEVDFPIADQPRTEPRPPLRIRASDHIGSKQSCKF